MKSLYAKALVFLSIIGVACLINFRFDPQTEVQTPVQVIKKEVVIIKKIYIKVPVPITTDSVKNVDSTVITLPKQPVQQPPVAPNLRKFRSGRILHRNGLVT